MDKGLLRRLAVLCKDYYTLNTIDNLFIYSGAEDSWYVEPAEGHGSMRMDRFYGWVEGIQARVPDQAEEIVLRIAAEVVDKQHISETDRSNLKRTIEAARQQQSRHLKVPKSIDLDTLLSTLARLLAADGLAREVAIVAYSTARMDYVGSEPYQDGEVDWYDLYLQIPPKLYGQVAGEQDSSQKKILDYAKRIVDNQPNQGLQSVFITPSLVPDDKWRDRAIAWLAGEGVNNQGRVRSSNVAPLSSDGLLFRSPPEIELYKALKATGVSFAPLPVFVRGGIEYRRIEPDFVVLKGGIVMIIEVDGDTVHQETPAEAHARTTMLAHEGAHVERVKASECDTPEKAAACAKRLLQVLAKLKAAR